MVHRNLTFATLTTAKHALFVFRHRSDRTLYVSTPFLPGATKPSFMQALLGQIISAYREALERNTRKETTQNDKKGDAGQDGQNDNDMRHHRGNCRGGRGNGGRGNGGRGGGNGGTREGDDCDDGGCRGHCEEGIYNATHSKMFESNEKADQGIKIPVATHEQLALSKVCNFPDCS
jgi:hypothetical protein